MKNLYASVFVLLFLAACASHVYENTHVGKLLDVPDHMGDEWRDRVKREF